MGEFVWAVGGGLVVGFEEWGFILIPCRDRSTKIAVSTYVS